MHGKPGPWPSEPSPPIPTTHNGNNKPEAEEEDLTSHQFVQNTVGGLQPTPNQESPNNHSYAWGTVTGDKRDEKVNRLNQACKLTHTLPTGHPLRDIEEERKLPSKAAKSANREVIKIMIEGGELKSMRSKKCTTNV